MTVREIRILKEDLVQEIPVARQMLKSADLFLTFQTIDRGLYGTTILNIRMLEILEKALSVIMETAKQMRNLITADKGEGFALFSEMSADEIVFTNIFSVFAASVEVSESCRELVDKITEGKDITVEASEDQLKLLAKAKIKPGGTLNIEKMTNIVRLDSGSIPRKILRDYKDYIQFYRDHNNPVMKTDSSEKLITCTKAYFELMKNTMKSIAEDAHYAPLREALESIDVNILGKCFKGFSYALGETEKSSQLMPVTLDQIIGNKKYIQAARKLARDIAGYDFEAGENPKRLNPILFAMGNPGCGKTITAHAIGNSFLDFCNRKNIPAKFVIIRRTDWASSYQNASAQNLIDIFKKNVLGFKGVVGIYWPDIDTAFAARGDSGLRNEEKNILGAVFGLFDGTILPKDGRWFMMCDANYLNMDKATISRITQDPYYVRGPENPEDYIKLFRDIMLSHHKEFLTLNESEWGKFGQFCIDHNISGRGIDNISRKVISVIEDFELPDEYFDSKIDRKREIIREYSNKINYEQLSEILENYIEFEKEAEEKADMKEFDDRVNEIRTYLSAQQHVIKSFEEEAKNIESPV